MTPELDEQALACNLDAIIAQAERDSHVGTIETLLTAVLESVELADGYGYRLPADPTILQQIGTFIANERKCCSFFRFELVAESGGGPVWLRITGPEGTKQILAAEMLRAVPADKLPSSTDRTG